MKVIEGFRVTKLYYSLPLLIDFLSLVYSITMQFYAIHILLQDSLSNAQTQFSNYNYICYSTNQVLSF